MKILVEDFKISVKQLDDHDSASFWELVEKTISEKL
jgi:hypothetical protein